MSYVTRNSLFGISLLDIRLWFHVVAFVHLLVTAVVTLSIDPTVDEDPKIRVYISTRWKLITCWFNLITMAYLPLCIYCETKDKMGFGDSNNVQRVRRATDVLMTSVIFPTTMSADIVFWVLMTTNVGLMAPPKLFDYMPYWCQHSLHTVSMAVVLLDLLLTPRARPRNMIPSFLIASGFVTSYVVTIYVSYLRGEIVYSFIDIFSVPQTIMFIIFSYILFITFYFIQWKIISFVWSEQRSSVFKKKV